VTWLVGLLVVSAIIVLLWLSRWRHREEEMGSVSGQWLAEYRQDRNP
jgi:hypothetical protein